MPTFIAEMPIFAITVAVLIVLFPVAVDELPLPIRKSGASTITGTDARSPLHKFDTNLHPRFDKEAFLASFKRQSNELQSCLHKWKDGGPSVLATAQMSPQGHLRHLSRADNGESFPSCVTSAIEKMDFIPLASEITPEGLSLEWRIEW